MDSIASIIKQLQSNVSPQNLIDTTSSIDDYIESATEARVEKEIIVDRLIEKKPIHSGDQLDSAKPILRNLVNELEEEGYLKEDIKPIVHKVVDRMTESAAEEEIESLKQQEEQNKEG